MTSRAVPKLCRKCGVAWRATTRCRIRPIPAKPPRANVHALKHDDVINQGKTVRDQAGIGLKDEPRNTRERPARIVKGARGIALRAIPFPQCRRLKVL